MPDPAVPPTIAISHLATGPTPPPAANQDGPNVLHTRVADVVARWARRRGPGGSSRTSASSSR